MEETLVTNPYSGTNPVKQHHRNGCWAACLEWWSKGVLGNGGYTQDGIRRESSVKAMYKSNSVSGQRYGKSNSQYGTLETNELIGLLQRQPWSLSATSLTNFSAPILQTKLANGPVFVGFFDQSGNVWHVNIACNYDAEYDMAVVMEPRTGIFMDKAFSDFTAMSSFNVLGWKV